MDVNSSTESGLGMKAYDALAKAFVAEGTTDVFGMMGDANMHWLAALSGLGTNLFDARHEGAALAMADGWARIAGRPGVVTATSGPGTSQLATTMIVASRARTPLVAFCGETSVGEEEAVQRFDQERFAAAIECGYVHLSKAELAFDVVQKAFYLARSESRPIMISAPLDVQKQAFDDDMDYVTSVDLLGTYQVPPDADQIEQAASIIEGCDNIVILVGRGAKRPEVEAFVLRLQERTGALIATSLQAKNWMCGTTDYHVGISGLFGTKTAMELLQTADCVIAVGASLNKYTTEHGYLYPDAKFIHIDKKPYVVMGSGKRADCYIQADAELALQELVRTLDEHAVQKVGFHTDEVKAKLSTANDDPQVFEIEPNTVDPREACRIIDNEIPTDIGMVLGGGHQTDFGTALFNRPRDVLANYGMFGAIGQGLLLTMGACVAKGKPTFVVEGDAGFMMHLAEFETACRYGLPILVVVFNDQALGAEFHKMKAIGLDPQLAVITTPDLGKVAEDFGGRGALAHSAEELRLAVKQFVAEPEPTVIDVRISRNVLSVPYRRLWYGADV